MEVARDDMPATHTILFLIADTGAGHRRAAQAICRAITLLSLESNQMPLPELSLHLTNQAPMPLDHAAGVSGYRLECVDALSVCGRFPLASLSRLYRLSIRYAPRLYGALFQLTSHRSGFRLLEWLIYRQLRFRLAELLGRLNPDVIVSIHPLLSHAALRVQADGNRQVPFFTVMTDLATPHVGWIAPTVDGCIVPTERARDVCRGHGMPERSIHLLGMPIDLAFSCSPGPSEAARAACLPTALPTVLLVGGGEGAGKLAQLAGAIWQADMPLRLLVVSGRNRRVKRQLERMASRFPRARQRGSRIFGFVENMDELMRAADVIVTKAGPSTICEAIACGLPIVLSGYVPGQEEGNVRYVCDQGIGILAETPAKLVATLQECLRPGSSLLQQMQAHMEGLQSPLASLAIARLILESLSPRVLERRRGGVADAV